MPAYSGTSVQKTVKSDVTSLFARIQGAGAANATVITAGGLSKGIASCVRNSIGSYTITLDSNFPVSAFLGSVCAVSIEGPGSVIVYSRIASTSASARTITINTLDGTGTLADPTSSYFLNCTITYTPSPVF